MNSHIPHITTRVICGGTPLLIVNVPNDGGVVISLVPVHVPVHAPVHAEI